MLRTPPPSPLEGALLTQTVQQTVEQDDLPAVSGAARQDTRNSLLKSPPDQSKLINPHHQELPLQRAFPPVPTHPPHAASKFFVASSTKSKDSSRKKISLQLKRLEEQKALEEKFLAKKYEILQGINSDEEEDEDDNPGDHADNVIPPAASRGKVEHWLKWQNETQNSTRRTEIPHSSMLNKTWFAPKPPPHDHENTLPINNHHHNEEPILPSAATQRGFRSTRPGDSHEGHRLTQRQMAARQSIPKELPTFHGNPEDWPLFISSFESSTNVCGFSEEENLGRLRACLRGKALEAVRCRLSQPGQVQRIISTLQLMFGRPEIIINSLLLKMRREPLPKADKLDSIVKYALDVENICATMEISGCASHLNNPILLQELVERLPPSIRLNWSIYKQTLPLINISQFSAWLFEVGRAANDVTFSYSTNETKLEHKQKPYINVHNEISANNKKCKICNRNCPAVENCETFLSYNLQQRWAVLKEKKLCRTCLKRHTNSCKSNQLCGENGCTYRHNRLLHKHNPNISSEKESSLPRTITRHHSTRPEALNYTLGRSTEGNSAPVTAPSTATQPTILCHTQSKENTVLFRILPVTLYGKLTKIKTFAFLDDGSSTSLIEEELANSLGVEGEHIPLQLKWTANTVRLEADSRKIGIAISGDGKENKYQMFGVRTVKQLDLPQQTIDVISLATRYKHLKGIPINSFSNANPRILIGLKNWNLGIPLKTKEGKADEPVATKTRLGWVVFGPCDTRSHKNLSMNYHLSICNCDCSRDDEPLHLVMKEFCAIESMGTKRVYLQSPDDEKATRLLDAGCKRVSNHFEVPLLWKNTKVSLPDSEPNAIRRLQCLMRRLEKEPNLYKLISELIRDYVEKGYARKIDITTKKNDKTWYLPIFPVFNINKPNKIRLVWDASSEVNGVSLNTFLLTGPDIVSPLLGILFRFRERKVGLCADIKEMFHQVRIREEDQESQRFLWQNGETGEIETYVLQVLSFGATSSPFCAQYVKNRNAEDFREQFPDAVHAIVKNHYVDDFIGSYDSEEEAAKIAKEVVYVHNQGGFEIRNFRSNAQTVMNGLEHRVEDKNLSIPTTSAEKVLGMWWSPAMDEFFFKFNFDRMSPDVMSGNKAPTKREVLRLLMRIYDPIGLIANLLVNIKILLQSIWRSGIGWDEPIKHEQLIVWNKWLRLLPLINDIRVPRTYLTTLSFANADRIELHIFCDASEEALSAVAYIRVRFREQFESRLIAAKTKVAPLRRISIPRMELEAAVLGSRLASTIIDSHSIRFTQQTYWTDSKTVIYWIRSPTSKFQQFVSLRIGEILERTNAAFWKWVPSKLNVADEATKIRTTFDFSSHSIWYCGPHYLKEDEKYWPVFEHESNREVEQLYHADTNEICVIDINRFSKWRKLLNTMTRVFGFVDLLSKRSVPKLQFKVLLQKAERYLWKQAQREAYNEEIRVLDVATTQEESVIPKASKLYKLSPYLDENGLLRIAGRIDAMEGLNHDVKRPIVLPRDHHTTRLILDHYHRKFHHQYNETVVNEVRQTFYIPGLRTMVKKVQNQCQQCRNRRAEPSVPIMGPLPPARLKTFTRPFSFIGMDYFGPLIVAVGRRREKRWGVLITCLTIRAIHIEIAYSLTTDSCIQALQRFIARRGMPTHIYTDNGTNFRGASRELRVAIDQIDGKKLVEGIGEGKLEWSFIPPGAPHMGGSWERLVRSVKQTLAQINFNKILCDELLQTMLAEVENIINSRPLTYVPISAENEEALTPNHFLLGSSNGSKPIGSFQDGGVILKQNWLAAEQFSNLFWRRWIREYLPNLTRRTKWFQPTNPISVNDIVIVVDQSNPRNSWPKGRVLEVNPGRDGKIRSVTIQTKNGVYTRPVSKLAILDVASSKDSGKQDQRDQSPNLPGGSVEESGIIGTTTR